MRKLVLLTFISLDGVMQAPGGPEEDTSGGFKYGGWTFPYFDEFLGNVMGKQMGMPFDLLLGRKTYDLFASFWPKQDTKTNPAAEPLNKATKYVAANTTIKLGWENSVLLEGDVVAKIRDLKAQDGPILQVHGSSNLIQTLLKNDLVDELWLKIFPVTLGKGKRLFGDGTIPAAFKLSECESSPKGVIVATYERAGEVKTGSFSD
ncbi:MAG TPA: dihydrofolate reductase family protein [Candidatus Saccharimonadales bacterium]|nr:dihydrofolate reductase family protein [Candidatus Saccharimonadales bacterium]